MALTIGTNCGFVTSSPSSDPAATAAQFDNYTYVNRDTSPAGYTLVTEIGFWLDSVSTSTNYEVGIYDGNSTSPSNVIGNLYQTNTMGTTGGIWKSVPVTIIIKPSTVYWIGGQCDTASGLTKIDYAPSYSGARYYERGPGETTMPSPWSGGTGFNNVYLSFYAKVETIRSGVPYMLSGAWSLSGSTANSGSLTVNVPTGTTLALIGVTGYKNTAQYFSSGSMTLGGSAMTLVCQADADTTKYQGALWYLVNPSSGSQTLAYDWVGTGTPTNYPLFIGTHYANVDTSSPIRSSGSQQVTSGTATTGSMTGQTGDMAVAFGFGYANAPGANNMAFTSGSEILETYSGKSCVGWAYDWHNGNVTMTRTDVGPMDDGGICGVILKPLTASLSGSQIQIGGSWKGLVAYSINIGDVWKSVSAAQINIGDVWKPITI